MTDKPVPKSVATIFIAFLLNQLRKWLIVIVLIGGLGLTVATHTIGGLADLTGQVIQAVTGLTTTTVQARAQHDSQPNITSENANLQRRLDEATTTLNIQRQQLSGHVDVTVALRDQFARQQIAVRDIQTTQAALVDDLTAANAILREQSQNQLILLRDMRAVQTETLQLNKSLNQHSIRIKFLTRMIVERIQQRTAKTASVNVGSVFGEAVPFWGIAFIVGATTFELASACDTMGDLYDLQVAVDITSVIPEIRDEVCGLQVPTKDEIWGTVKSSPERAWRGSVSAVGGVKSWAGGVEPPDFGGYWSRMIAWFGEF